jgi:hypothetical protein
MSGSKFERSNMRFTLFSFQFNVAQSELDIILSNQQSEENKLRETKRNLEKVSTTLKERKSYV